MIWTRGCRLGGTCPWICPWASWFYRRSCSWPSSSALGEVKSDKREMGRCRDRAIAARRSPAVQHQVMLWLSTSRLRWLLTLSRTERRLDSKLWGTDSTDTNALKIRSKVSEGDLKPGCIVSAAQAETARIWSLGWYGSLWWRDDRPEQWGIPASL